MEIYEIEVSEEIHDFDAHYWVNFKARINPEEDAVEKTKILRAKIKLATSSDIQIKKVFTTQEEYPTIDINDR